MPKIDNRQHTNIERPATNVVNPKSIVGAKGAKKIAKYQKMRLDQRKRLFGKGKK